MCTISLSYDKYGNLLNFPFLGAIKAYFKILNARQKRPTTCTRFDGQIIDKQTKIAVSSRRNQRGHNVGKIIVCLSIILYDLVGYPITPFAVHYQKIYFHLYQKLYQ